MLPRDLRLVRKLFEVMQDLIGGSRFPDEAPMARGAQRE
jgi:hypothetical protein